MSFIFSLSDAMNWRLRIGICIIILSGTFSCSEVNDMSGSSALAELPDSVSVQLNLIRNQQNKIEYLMTLCEEWHETKPTVVLTIAELLEDWTIDSNDKYHYAKALYWKSYILNQQGPEKTDLNKVLADVKISINYLEEFNDPLWLARTLNLRALIHYNLYQEKIGEEYNSAALEIIQLADNNDPNTLSTWGDIFRTAGNIRFYLSENLDTAIYFYDKSHAYYSQSEDKKRLAQIFTNYALVYEINEKWDLADSCYQLAIEWADQLGDNDTKANTYLDYAAYHSEIFKDSQEVKWFTLSNKWLASALDLNPKNETEIYYQYGANYQNLALYTNDTLYGYIDTAGFYYNIAISFGVKEKNSRYIEKATKEVAKICYKIGLKSCTQLLQKSANAYVAVVDSTSLALEEAAEKMEDYKDRETQEDKRKAFYWSAFLLVFLASLSILLQQRARIKHLNRQANIKQEALNAQQEALRAQQEAVNAQMKTLSAQMNPHFISNSLNAIDSLINQERNDEASEYIIDFSRLCRQIIKNSQESLISLSRELEILGYYLSLEKLRMGNKLSYKIELSSELNQNEVLIPPMLLQPFIENAIMHGIQKKQTAGQLSISIQQVDDDTLECIIADDGIGRKKAEALKAESVIARPSYGIEITKKRIDAIKHMEDSKIEIIDLHNQQGEASGTRVVIHIPLITPENPNQT